MVYQNILEVTILQIYQLDLLLVLRKSVFLPVNEFQMQNLIENETPFNYEQFRREIYHLFNP